MKNEETLEFKTYMCPYLSHGTDWKRLAIALPLSVLLQYEERVKLWTEKSRGTDGPPICQWVYGRKSTDTILALTALHADGIKY